MLCAISAQMLWGCFPIYIYMVKSIDPIDFVAHRATWSFLFLISVFSLSSWFGRSSKHPSLPDSNELFENLRRPASLRMSALAAVLIAINWLCFVWAVTNDHAIDASLGYYICPQVVVLMGVIFLQEKLNLFKWLGVAFAACGVAYMARSTSGIPWVAIVIAFSFGFYGLVKKQTKLSALGGLTFETGFLLLPAIVYLGWRWATSTESPFDISWWVGLMLLASGLVTIAPLALYTTAVKKIPLSTVGLLQFIGPTIQFVIGIFLIGESLDYTRLIGFSIVWAGVVIFLYGLRK